MVGVVSCENTSLISLLYTYCHTYKFLLTATINVAMGVSVHNCMPSYYCQALLW